MNPDIIVERHWGASEDLHEEAVRIPQTNGVAVTRGPLLFALSLDETVRDEAIRMIKSGRALQARELRGLKRDIALAKAAVEGTLDDRRRRASRNAAARKARDKALAAADLYRNTAGACGRHVHAVGRQSH